MDLFFWMDNVVIIQSVVVVVLIGLDGFPTFDNKRKRGGGGENKCVFQQTEDV